jgi:predicted  nucleic acid-binding Zn-ribbon protein
MDFSNRQEKLEYDIARVSKEIEYYEQEKKDLEFRHKNNEACLKQWIEELTKLKSESGPEPVQKDEK